MRYIKQTWTNGSTTTRVPGGKEAALAVKNLLLDTEIEILKDDETLSTEESSTPVASRFYELSLKDTTGKTAYMRLFAKHNVDADEFQEKLKGITVNGVLVDRVIVLGYRAYIA